MAKRALGRGLSALLGDSAAPPSAPTAVPEVPAASGTPPVHPSFDGREAVMLRVDELRANPNQPRRTMDEDALEELAASIRQNGVLQPVLARRTPTGFELVAGERRLRASRMAGKEEIPALVCTMEETESLKIALLENIQREDLDAIEEAQAYRAIMDRYGATHQEVADMLGKNRSTVTNMLRLLSLETSVREMVSSGSLSMGHARALLALEDSTTRMRIAREAARDGTSVRVLEKQVQRLTGRTRSRRRPDEGETARTSDPEQAAVQEFEDRLRHRLGSPVTIRRRGQKGRIEVEFFSNEELERLLERMGISSQL